MTDNADELKNALGQSVPLSDELDITELHDISFVGDMKRLSVNPGDIFVVMFEQILSCEQRNKVKQILEGTLSGHKVIVLDGNAKISDIAGLLASEP